MQITDYSFEDLPFSKLFKTYHSNFRKLNRFYAINPFDEDALTQQIKNFQFSGDRSQSVELLTAFNKQFKVDQPALENVSRLSQESAVAVVTGQQLGIYGGPHYTIFKTLSTILHARQLEEKYHRPVIPVFWLADEDHDYDEVRSLQLLDGHKLKKYELPTSNRQLSPVAEQRIPAEIDQLRHEIKEALYDTEFSDDLWKLLDNCFETGNTFLSAFGKFMGRLFSRHGLVLAGSNSRQVKEATKEYVKQSVKKSDEISNLLEKQSHKISEDFHQQVTLFNSNLFYLDDEAGRLKINKQENSWKTESGRQWKTDELLEEIEKQPQCFSPNVFLRPILQDVLLPTFGYVAGPGELAYYGQMKTVYSCFNLSMPVIFPRLSATLIEPSIDRIINELPFDFHEYSNRIEDLESAYVNRTEHLDIEAVFKEWKKKVGQIADLQKQKLADVDPTLEGAAGKATAVYAGELDKLKGKLYRAVKQQDETQLKRIRRIQANLFPDGGMQERMIAAIFYMNKYGLDIWDELLKSLDGDEKFDHHKLIYL